MTLDARLDKLRKKLEQIDGISPQARQFVLALAAEPDATQMGPHCLDELAVYVEAEVAGVEVGTAYPEIRRHLLLCDDCAATYIELTQLATGELSDENYAPSFTPVPDLTFLSRPSLPNLSK